MAEAEATRDYLKPKENLRPKPISCEEVSRVAKINFREKIANGTFSSGNVEIFVREHVRGLRIGSVDVLIIDQEHSELDLSKGLPPVLKAYIASGRTTAVLEEYFNPELRINAENMPVLGKAASLLPDFRKLVSCTKFL